MMDIRIFALICVVLGGMGQGVVSPQLPTLLEKSKALAFASGLSATIMYFGIFVSTYTYGKWADKGKVHFLMAPGLFLYAITLLLLGIFHQPSAIFLIRFFEGLALSAVFVAADFILGRMSEAHERGKWLSFYGVALSVGLLTGPAVVLLSERIFPGPRSTLFALIAVALIAILLGIPSLRLRVKIAGNADTGNYKLNLAALFCGAIYGYMEAGLVAVFPVIALNEFHVRPEYCLFVVILSAAVSSVFWGTLSDKKGARPVLLVLFLLLFLGPLAMTQSPAFFSLTAVAYVSSALFGILAGGIYPVGFSWLLQSLPESQYGFASGSFARAYGLGSLIGPLAVGIASQYYGSTGLFSLLALGGTLGLYSARKQTHA